MCPARLSPTVRRLRPRPRARPRPRLHRWPSLLSTRLESLECGVIDTDGDAVGYL